MQNKSNDNAPRHFNLTARILHWLMAAAILAMLFIGVGMTTSMTWRPWLIDIHRPLGIAILLLVIIRLINRLCYPIPPLPPSVPRWQAFLAHASHWLLYILMFSLPLLGWATLSAGRCVVMHTTVNSRPAVIVLLGEPSTQARNNDVTNLLGWLSNLPKRI